MNKPDTTISAIYGYEILDSRGNPTVAAVVSLADGSQGKAYVPSGASTGTYEAVELRDKDSERYDGKGVQTAVRTVNTTIADTLRGTDAAYQENLDKTLIDLDGTSNKERLGANAILGVSLASARATAHAVGKELYEHLHELYINSYGPVSITMPQPALNVINGGEHADSGLDVQEFMILPQRKEIRENLRIAAESYHALKRLLVERGYQIGVGDEGGFAPRLETPKEALDLLKEAIKIAGHIPGTDVTFGLDVAAGEFYEGEESYRFQGERVSSEYLAQVYDTWFADYPLETIEDPFAEDDTHAWQRFRANLPEGIGLIGDDLLVTNTSRIQMGIEQGLANGLLVKPNQVGTLSETFAAIARVYREGWDIMVSHRSGETSDTFIADLAVAVGARRIKSGAPARGERTAKYNRLLEIEYKN